MKELSAVTYLMTKEDYIKFMIAAKSGRTDSQDKTLMRVLGIFMLLIGLITQSFSIPSLTVFEKNIITVAVVIFGFIMLTYFDFICPFMEKIKAEKFCNKNSNKMISNTIKLYDNQIKVENDRYSAELPFSIFNMCYENSDVFVLYISLNECIFIPKRIMDDKELSIFTDTIHSNIKKCVIKNKK